MDTTNTSFTKIVEDIYKLPLDEKLEIMNLLGHNIADVRRDEIHNNYQASLNALQNDELEFSSDLETLKNQLKF